MVDEIELDYNNNSSLSSAQNMVFWGGTVSGSQGNDIVEAIDLDASGNTYVCGYYYGNTNFGTISLNSPSNNNGFVGKIDSHGNWLWVQNIGNSNSENEFLIYKVRNEDWFIAKLDTNGNWVWSTELYGNHYDVGEGIDVNDNGDIAVVGYSSYDIYVGNFGWQYPNYRSSTARRIFVATLDNNGSFTSGVYLGSHTNQDSYAEDVVIDNSGIVTLTAMEV